MPVQLGAALEVDEERVRVGASSIVLVSAVILVSADNELNSAAQSAGLRVEDPNAYP
ncbi:MAG: hypothetical protein ACREDR_13485 [Blastocatellia bacterium]